MGHMISHQIFGHPIFILIVDFTRESGGFKHQNWRFTCGGIIYQPFYGDNRFNIFDIFHGVIPGFPQQHDIGAWPKTEDTRKWGFFKGEMMINHGTLGCFHIGSEKEIGQDQIEVGADSIFFENYKKRGKRYSDLQKQWFSRERLCDPQSSVGFERKPWKNYTD